MRSWIPSTLFGRSFLLLSALIVFAEIATLVVFFRSVQLPRITRAASVASFQLNLTQETVRGLPPAEQLAYLRNLAKAGAQVQPMPPSASDAVPRDIIVRRFFQHMQSHLINGKNLLWDEASQTMYFQVFEGEVGRQNALAFSPDGIYIDTLNATIAAALLCALAALSGAYFIQRRLNRPLEQLAQSAELLGQGRPPLALSPHAPDEIQQVSSRINAMAQNLAKLTEEKTLMLAGVSHDLRTPLAKMRLSLEMLGPHADAELHAALARSVAEMESIINQFIEFARTGQDEAPTFCDVNKLIRDVVTECVVPAGHAPIEVITEALPSCRLRPITIKRALTNLVNNALHYGVRQPSDTVTIDACIENDTLHLAVLDRGPGLSDDEEARVRKPFARKDKARSGQSRAGLGLAIVERAAQLHGGALQLKKRDGGGLVASMELPIAG